MSKTEKANASAIAIVGMGCLFPDAVGIDEFWARVKSGADAVGAVPATHWRPDDYFSEDKKAADRTYARRGAFLTPYAFNPLEWGISPHDLEATDTSQLLSMVVAQMALTDAGYGPKRAFDKSRVSCVMGVTGTLELVVPLAARLGHPIWKKALSDAGVDKETAADVMDRIQASYVGWQENSFPGLLGNVVAGRIANRLNLGGTNCVVDAACASSLSALHLATLELAAGQSDMVVTGGVDTFNDIFMYMCFSKTPALSPTGDARPFAAAADGTILGEGIGALILKRLSDAERDGDRVHAVILGIGTSSDGKGQAIYAPSVAGQERCLRAAYAEAGVDPQSIGLVEGHGTGTKVGDAVEVSALRRVFGEPETGAWCALGSVKSQIGHTKAAAGVAGLIKAAMALANGVIPPTIKVDAPADGLGGGAFYLPRAMRPWLRRGDAPRRAAVSAFGFGGSNFHCILEEAPENLAFPAAVRGRGGEAAVQIVPYAGTTRAALEAEARADAASCADWAALRRLAAARRQSFDRLAPERLVFVVDDLAAFRAGKGAFHGSGAPLEASDIAVMFPGQGAQATGMLRELACDYPEMRASLAMAERAAGGARRLCDDVYPTDVWSEADLVRAEARLTATDRAQPALGAVCAGAWTVLESLGLTPGTVFGHSFGELTALFAAGVLDEPALHAMAAARGVAMAAQGAAPGTQGAEQGAAPEAARGAEQREAQGAAKAMQAAVRKAAQGAVPEAEQRAALGAAPEAEQRAAQVAAPEAEQRAALGAAPEAEQRAAKAIQAAVHKAAQGAAHGTVPEAEQGAAIVMQAAVQMAAQGAEQGAAPEAKQGEQRAAERAEQGTEQVGARGAAMAAHMAAADRPALPRQDLGTMLAVSASRARVAAILASGVFDDVVIANDNAPEQVVLAGTRSGLDAARVALNGAGLASRSLNVGAAFHSPLVAAAAEPFAAMLAGVAFGRAKAVVLANTTAAAYPDDADEARALLAHQLAKPVRFVELVQEAGRRGAKVFIEVGPGARLCGLVKRTLREARVLALDARDGDGGTAGLARLLAELAAAGAALRLERWDQAAAGLASPAPGKKAMSVPLAGANYVRPERRAGRPPRVSAAPSLLPVVPGIIPLISPAAKLKKETGMALDRTQITREAVLALQKIQEQSAQLHREFLEGQRETQRMLVELLGGAAVAPPRLAAAMAASAPPPPLAMGQAARSAEPPDFYTSATPVAVRPREASPQRAAVPAPAVPVLSPPAYLARSLAVGPQQAVTPAPAVPSAVAPVIIAVIAEKTGYPADMLDLSMSLEGDLGIDSIKRVEIFSELSARIPAAARLPSDELTRLKTLAEIVAVLSDPATVCAPPAAAVGGGRSPGVRSGATAGGALEPIVIAVIAEKTGYPPDMLDLSMSLEGDLGIDSIKRVEIFSALQEALPAARQLPSELVSGAQTLAEIVAALSASTPKDGARPPQVDRYRVGVAPLSPPPGGRVPDPEDPGFFVVASQDDPLAGALITELSRRGFIATALPYANDWEAAGLPAKVGGLVVCAPRDPGTARDGALIPAFAAARRVRPFLAKSAGGTPPVFATVTALGGRFGLDGGEFTNEYMFTAGLGGLAKSAAWEWPDVRCLAFDTERDGDPARAAAALADELTAAETGARPVEIGWADGVLHQVRLAREDLAPADASEASALAPRALVVVTGGARGVTAAVAGRLAVLYQPTFLLLGRSPVPAQEPAWLARLTLEAEIKDGLIRENGGRMTPRELKAAYQNIQAAREMRATFATLEPHGAQVLYRAVDVRDGDSVSRALNEAQAAHGPVRALIHGAGVLQDSLITDKTSEQVATVLSTKLGGLAVLLDALDLGALDVLILFASSTGRFGRKGQSDYAVANEALAKLAWSCQRAHPRCRALALDWGPWDGGMVHASLKALFTAEGIETIALDDGAAYLGAELQRESTGPAELVILGKGSKIPGTAAGEPAREALRLGVSVAEFPVLADHVLNGRAVLPAALMIELLALAAVQRRPGLKCAGLDDFRVLCGVTLAPDERVELVASVGEVSRHVDGRFLVSVDLVSAARRHATATVILAKTLPAAPPAKIAAPTGSYARTIDRVYGDVLFHGRTMRLLASVDGISDEAITATLAQEPEPHHWLASPPRAVWLSAPGPLDAAFQLMILWSHERLGALSLPASVRHFRRYAGGAPVGMRLGVKSRDAARAVADVEIFDDEGQVVLTLEGFAATIEPSLAAVFRKNRLEAREPAPW